jgi:uncharacterized protein (DUF488 family)
MIATRGPNTLFTIGYEGLDLQGFLKYLIYHKVEALVDVREIPLSRKRGFSKTALSEAVSENGIAYEHIRALGSPKPMRTQLKTDRNYDTFFTAYENHLDEQAEALDALGSFIEEHRRVCLLCFERAHEQCHRSRVADRMASVFGGSLSVEPVKTWV